MTDPFDTEDAEPHTDDPDEEVERFEQVEMIVDKESIRLHRGERKKPKSDQPKHTSLSPSV